MVDVEVYIRDEKMLFGILKHKFDGFLGSFKALLTEGPGSGAAKAGDDQRKEMEDLVRYVSINFF